MIRKFFDIAVADSAAPPPPAPTAAEINGGNSIAALMAKQGTMNGSGGLISQPIPEKKEEPTPAPEAPPVATTTETSNAVEAKPESQPPAPEPTPTQEPEKVAEPVKVLSWQEVLKSQQPDTNTILKEVGFDDQTVQLINELKQFDPKVAGLVAAYKSGKHVEYLRELSTDYSKMAAEDVMRHQLKVENPGISDKNLDVLYKHKVIKAFSLNSDDEEEASEGRILLEAEADKYRKSFMTNQEQYLLPPAPEPKPVEVVDNSADIERQQKFEVYQNRMNEHTATKNLVSNKKVTLGEGREQFNFPVNDSKEILDVLYTDDGWQNAIHDVKVENGKKDFYPKVDKQLLIATVAKYGMDFMNAFAKHHQKLGSEIALESIENAKKPDDVKPGNPEVQPNNPAAAMAKNGRVNYGGYGR